MKPTSTSRRGRLNVVCKRLLGSGWRGRICIVCKCLMRGGWRTRIHRWRTRIHRWRSTLIRHAEGIICWRGTTCGTKSWRSAMLSCSGSGSGGWCSESWVVGLRLWRLLWITKRLTKGSWSWWWGTTIVMRHFLLPCLVFITLLAPHTRARTPTASVPPTQARQNKDDCTALPKLRSAMCGQFITVINECL